MSSDALLQDVETFIAHHGMAESTFGRSAMNDWKLVRMMRAGRRVWPENERRIRDFMTAFVADAARRDACDRQSVSQGASA